MCQKEDKKKNLKVGKLYPEYCLLKSSIFRKVKLCFTTSSIIAEIILKVLLPGLLINGGTTMVGSDAKSFDHDFIDLLKNRLPLCTHILFGL